MSGTIEVNRIQEFIENELRSNETLDNNSMETLVANLSTVGIRRAKLSGREHIVAPVSMIVPGVLNGSHGPLYYPKEEIAKNPSVWNGIPLVVYHPTVNGNPVSARTPEILDTAAVGQILKATVNSQGKLVAEAWFDVEACKRVDNRVLSSLLSGKQIELSTGLFTTNVPAPYNATHNGRPYTYIAKDYVPDHLAILPDQVGACSIKDGCGVLVNGGQGSGNFGHSGRPGERGGSSEGEGGESSNEVRADNEDDLKQFVNHLDSRNLRGEFGRSTQAYTGLKLSIGAFKESTLAAENNRTSLHSSALRLHLQAKRELGVAERWLKKLGETQDKPRENIKLLIKEHNRMIGYHQQKSSVQNTEAIISEVLNGGQGSGNFGHAGRPGELGGSAPSGGGSTETKEAYAARQAKQMDEQKAKDYAAKYTSPLQRSEHHYNKSLEHIQGQRDAKLSGDRKLELAHKMAAKAHQSAKTAAENEPMGHGPTNQYRDRFAKVQEAEQLVATLKAGETDKIKIEKEAPSVRKYELEAEKIHSAAESALKSGDRASYRNHVAAAYGLHLAAKHVESGRYDLATKVASKARGFISGKYKMPTNNQALLIAESVLNGGQGSGNFGHSGRPGERGGSSSGGSAGNKDSDMAEKHSTLLKRAKHHSSMAKKTTAGYIEKSRQIKAASKYKEAARFLKQSLSYSNAGNKKLGNIFKNLAKESESEADAVFRERNYPSYRN